MNDRRHRERPGGPAILVILTVLALSEPGASETGDFLCDPTESTADTCVVVGNWAIPDQSALRFEKPNLQVRGNLRTEFVGRCALAPATSCAADAECEAAAPCVRTGRITFIVAAALSVESGGEIMAEGKAAAGDTIGPDGGTITLIAHDVEVAGRLSVAADGRLGVDAGHAGDITISADGSVTLPTNARLDASTSTGACGGSISVGAPGTLDLAGSLVVDGATLGGSIRLDARELIAVSGTLQASNTGHPVSRPPCPDGKGGGRLALAARRVRLTGSATARGREAAGGTVSVMGEREVTVDSPPIIGDAISVSGGDSFASTPGGAISFVATGGDVLVRRGPINADGQGQLGSDAGTFLISATGAFRCQASDAACSASLECDPGDVCVEAGGQVLVEAPLSAAGGGSGCRECRIRSTGTVTLQSPVDVGGGRQQTAVGGKLIVAAGGDLTVGPGLIRADAADGGTISLIAGERADVTTNLWGRLKLVAGTKLLAEGSLRDGFGGDVEIVGCDVAVESNVRVSVEGGDRGTSGRLNLVARERVTVAPLADFSARPDGSVRITYRLEAAIAPEAIFRPALSLVTDPSLPPCPVCGNGLTEPREECDGPGTCQLARETCIPPGAPGQCTCADTCGVTPGIQPGEDCDGDDLGGRTCASLGFVGGTLGCTVDCTFDTRACLTGACGDGIVAPSEQCDVGGPGVPPNFNGESCETLGFLAGGTLTCAPGCSAVLTAPHCSASVTQTCVADSGCPAAESCAPGCHQCGNGFVDPGEDCDDGASNDSAANRCREDCRRPRCGDESVDFSHCSADRDRQCSNLGDCLAGQSCVLGELCDQGTASCVGGPNDGAPCCRETDCPAGDCPGDDCSQNRDDVAGCCPCSCGVPSCSDQAGASCDDGNPCTLDACAVTGECTHAFNPDGTACGETDACSEPARCHGGVCTPGATVSCDDGDACTFDRCDPLAGCRNERPSYEAAQSAVDGSLAVDACVDLPPSVDRLLRRARGLLERAESAARPRKAARLVGQATKRLKRAAKRALQAGQHGLPPTCSTALAETITDAVGRAQCLARAVPQRRVLPRRP